MPLDVAFPLLLGDATVLLLTNSRLKAKRLCPRYHHFRYERGYASARKAEALTFGSAFHVGMERYWRKDEGTFPSRGLLADEFDDAALRALLVGYRNRWETEDERYETLAVEQAFETPFIHPATGAENTEFVLAGKLDLVIRDRDTGEVLVGEHKTSGEDISFGAAYWMRLALDSQILVYTVGARALGYQNAATLYDVAYKPRQRPKKGESPEAFYTRIVSEIAEAPQRYYARCRLTRFPGEIDAALVDAWEWAERMSADARDGVHPRNVDACFKYGRACEFHDVCIGSERLDNAEKFVHLTNPNPELSA